MHIFQYQEESWLGQSLYNYLQRQLNIVIMHRVNQYGAILNSNYSEIERKIKNLQQIGQQQSKQIRELLLKPMSPRPKQHHPYTHTMGSLLQQPNSPPKKGYKKRYRCQDYMQRVQYEQQVRCNNLPQPISYATKKDFLDEWKQPSFKEEYDEQIQYLKSEQYKQYLGSLMQAHSQADMLRLIQNTRHYANQIPISPKAQYKQKQKRTTALLQFQEQPKGSQMTPKTNSKQEISGQQNIQPKKEKRSNKYIKVTEESEKESLDTLQAQSKYKINKKQLSLQHPPNRQKTYHPLTHHTPQNAKNTKANPTFNSTFAKQLQFCQNSRNRKKKQIYQADKENKLDQDDFQVHQQNKQSQPAYSVSFKIEKPVQRQQYYGYIKPKSKTPFSSEYKCYTETQESQNHSILGHQDNPRFVKSPTKISVVSKSKFKKG